MNNLNNTQLLRFSTNINSYELDKKALSAAKRFICTAAALSDGEYLGWELSGERFTVFSQAGCGITAEDYDWIFQNCASVGDAAPSDAESQITYAFRVSEPAFADKENNMEPFCDALKELNNAGAVLRMTVGASGGELTVGLNEKMSLRLRTALAMAFNGLAVADGTPEPLPKESLISVMGGVLYAFIKKVADIPSDDLYFIFQSDYDEEELDETPLAELDLSIRTYNCLLRAGINSVEKLRRLSDEDLKGVRRLGHKGIEEGKAKLSLEKAEASDKSADEQLGELIGLSEVKAQIAKIAAFARMQKDMASRGMEKLSMSFNMEFVGAPGTAKTTVARILAKKLCEIGLLTSGEIVEVGRPDLVARYEGQTADDVKRIFQKAKGRLLFVDEAYSLAEGLDGAFGDEAINTIVQEMENHREETIVVFAGYPREMDVFFSRNPGLRSRVPFKLTFSDYSAPEMADIVELEARKRGFAVSDSAKAAALAICERAKSAQDAGNGRFCRNLAESAILSFAARAYSSDEAHGENRFTLSAEDFAMPTELKKANSLNPIGFRL